MGATLFFGGPQVQNPERILPLREVKGSCRMGYALPKNMMILVVTVLGRFFFSQYIEPRSEGIKIE